ncbi:COMPASS component SWD2 [Nematocida sp. LUAm3]|nr:COMPASS component SWD2 [Nematocida sp. LUAm3]KAI5176262.1 COMPASS component SWD2 [Nematocida sp. LUAm2]KAI5176720.1 COMPASS component SWD2 [Nematocida sp. LUAm1]
MKILGYEEKYSFSPMAHSSYSPNGEVLCGYAREGSSLIVHSPVEGLAHAAIDNTPHSTPHSTPYSNISFVSNCKVAYATCTSQGAMALHVMDLETCKYTTHVPYGKSPTEHVTKSPTEHPTEFPDGLPVDLLPPRITDRVTDRVTDHVTVSACGDAHLLAVCPEGIWFWDVRQRHPVGYMPSRGNSLCKYSPDASMFTLLLPDTQEIKLFDVRSYHMGPYSSKKLSINGTWNELQYSGSGTRLIVTTEKELIYLNGISGKQISSLKHQNISSSSFSADDQYIFYSSESAISVCASETLKEIETFPITSQVTVTHNPKYSQLLVSSHEHATLYNATLHSTQRIT